MNLGASATPQDWDLVRLYAEGNTIRRISEQTGIPRETLRLRLRVLGVVMRHHPILYHLPRSQLDSDVGILLGLHDGDGWVSDEWGLALSRDDKTMLREVVNLSRNVLGVEPFISKKADYSVSIRSGQPQVKAFFVNYGFPQGRKARIVEVPRAILQTENLEIVKSFLKGLFSADGCFSYRRRQASCVLSVSSLNLRDGFIRLSAKVGFDFHAYSYSHRYGHNKVPLNVAYLGSRPEVLRWMTQVGSIKDTHIVKFREWKMPLP